VIPDWIIIIFVFTLGACLGSFLNVVIYRLPREKSLITPPSSCPACNAPIKFYDNIPIFSWLILMGRCRKCKAAISPRYFVIELFTALLFVATYVVYFMTPLRAGMPDLLAGGWLIYLIHIIMIASLVAASAIDLELYIIPLSICWFVTLAGLIGAAVGPLILDPVIIRSYYLFPVASAKVAILSAGALLGWIISLSLLMLGVFKTSYTDEQTTPDNTEKNTQETYNHRLEMLKEVVFLAPVIIGSLVAFKIYSEYPKFVDWWVKISQPPVIAGIMGSIWGYFIGCATVWATRIFGTLLFGKEAMGLGDVHLMGAAGAVLGPWPTVVAFFIAPFFGLLWATVQIFFRKIKQIPYGPFLSIGLFVVIILHDGIRNWLNAVMFR